MKQFIKCLLIAHYRRQVGKHVANFTGWPQSKVDLFMLRYATARVIEEAWAARFGWMTVAEMMVVADEDDFAALLAGDLDDRERTFEDARSRATGSRRLASNEGAQREAPLGLFLPVQRQLRPK